MVSVDTGIEKSRLEELYLYDILDSEEEKEFNDLISLAALICDCPISTITFVDKERQWFKARKNMPVTETPREVSFCAQAILQDDVLVVEDALKDLQFSTYPSVTGGIKIRFYAGSPVISGNGQNLGTICVIDTKPKTLTIQQKDALKKLSSQVSKLLELRLLNKKLQLRSVNLLRSAKSYREFFDDSPFAQLIVDSISYSFIAVNKAAQKLYEYTEDEFAKITLFQILPTTDGFRVHGVHNEVKENKKVSLVGNHIRKSGEEVVVEVTIAQIIFEGSEVLIATIIDLSEKLELQEKLVTEKRQSETRVKHATLSAQSQEREYLGKELHDNINQMLASTKLYLDIAYSDDKMRLDLIKQSREHLITTMNEIRTLSKRLVTSAPKGLNLVDAIDELLDPYYLTCPFELNYSYEGDLNALPVEMKIGLLRIIQEGINNIVKYAEPENVIITLSVSDKVELYISDDGKGFDTSEHRTGIGIRNIHERVNQFKGNIDISSSKGNGCRINVVIPLSE